MGNDTLNRYPRIYSGLLIFALISYYAGKAYGEGASYGLGMFLIIFLLSLTMMLLNKVKYPITIAGLLAVSLGFFFGFQ